MQTILAMLLALLCCATPSLAQSPQVPESAAHATLVSQAQKIKLGYTTEKEVIELLGQPIRTKDKMIMKKWGSEDLRILVYGPENNRLIIFLTNGLVSRVQFP
jgi:hypothetical protein